jgi:short-subunit dehydrogenase
MNKQKIPKVILITGCSSGFGLRMAARLAALGHRIYATMRNLEKIKPLLNEVQKRGGEVRVLPLDVADTSTIKEAMTKIKSEARRIDVLINNAGFGVGGFFEDLTQDEIREQFEVNFFGVQNVTREVLPIMREQKEGKIISISSIAGVYGLPGFGAYSASKWALEGFLESLYYELKPFGIQVCVIEPGTYNTNIFHENRRYAKNFFNPQSPYRALAQFLDQRTMEYVEGITKDPEDIARLVEKIINSKNPPFRNIPDLQARLISCFHRVLPFRLFSKILTKILWYGFDLKKLKM